MKKKKLGSKHGGLVAFTEHIVQEARHKLTSAIDKELQANAFDTVNPKEGTLIYAPVDDSQLSMHSLGVITLYRTLSYCRIHVILTNKKIFRKIKKHNLLELMREQPSIKIDIYNGIEIWFSDSYEDAARSIVKMVKQFHRIVSEIELQLKRP